MPQSVGLAYTSFENNVTHDQQSNADNVVLAPNKKRKNFRKDLLVCKELELIVCATECDIV